MWGGRAPLFGAGGGRGGRGGGLEKPEARAEQQPAPGRAVGCFQVGDLKRRVRSKSFIP